MLTFRIAITAAVMDGDNGAGIGASHQTGWTGLVAPLIEIFGRLDGRTISKPGGPPPLCAIEGIDHVAAEQGRHRYRRQ
jgi:hypothetical protein